MLDTLKKIVESSKQEKKKQDNEKMDKNTIERSGQVKMFSNDETPREIQNKGCVGVQRKPSEAGMYIRGTVNNVPVLTLVDTGLL